MKRITLNPNYIKSSNLLFISAGLGLINFLILPEILSSKSSIVVGSIAVFFISAMGLAIRFEISWIKYLSLILIVFGINIVPPLVKDELISHPINGIITIAQSIIQIYATILLFSKKKRN